MFSCSKCETEKEEHPYSCFECSEDYQLCKGCFNKGAASKHCQKYPSHGFILKDGRTPYKRIADLPKGRGRPFKSVEDESPKKAKRTQEFVTPPQPTSSSKTRLEAAKPVEDLLPLEKAVRPLTKEQVVVLNDDDDIIEEDTRDDVTSEEGEKVVSPIPKPAPKETAKPAPKKTAKATEETTKPTEEVKKSAAARASKSAHDEGSKSTPNENTTEQAPESFSQNAKAWVKNMKDEYERYAQERGVVEEMLKDILEREKEIGEERKRLLDLKDDLWSTYSTNNVFESVKDVRAYITDYAKSLEEKKKEYKLWVERTERAKDEHSMTLADLEGRIEAKRKRLDKLNDEYDQMEEERRALIRQLDKELETKVVDQVASPDDQTMKEMVRAFQAFKQSMQG